MNFAVMETIRISIVEDVAEIRNGLQFLVNQAADFTCVSAYDNAEDALENLPGDAPDIVIMDIGLPRSTGIECIRKLRKQGHTMQFVIFTVFEDSDRLFDALSAGANGYLLKNTAPDKIIAALHELYEGGSPMSLSIARKVINSLRTSEEQNLLSAREMEILTLLSKGYLYKEIAANLFISVGTVRQHIHNIYEKLHVQNRTEAINKVFSLYR
jgi:DNA-binding NarL/FixJ family response regulator